MLTQLPDQDRVEHVVDRCRVVLGEDQAEVLLGWLAQDWQHADGEGTDLAEACITAHRGELTVRTAAVEDAP